MTHSADSAAAAILLQQPWYWQHACCCCCYLEDAVVTVWGVVDDVYIVLLVLSRKPSYIDGSTKVQGIDWIGALLRFCWQHPQRVHALLLPLFPLTEAFQDSP